MYVPEPVISLALKPVGQETPNFSRALNRFQKEDPTFRVHIDKESKEVRPLFILDSEIVDHHSRRSSPVLASSTLKSTSSG